MIEKAQKDGMTVIAVYASLFLALSLLLLYLTISKGQFDFTPDDSFIYFRFAHNLLSGDGLVYNPGEYVEGISSQTWILIASSFAMFSSLELAFSFKLIGVFFAAALILLVGQTMILLPVKRSVAIIAAIVAGLTLTFDPGFRIWAVSGMETTMYGFLLILYVFVAAWRTVQDQPLSQCFGLYAIAAVIVFSRPEGFAYFIAFHGIAVFSDLLTARARAADILLPAPLAFSLQALVLCFGLRYLYYGAWLPNPVTAKTGTTLTLRIMMQGVEYIGGFASQPLPLISIGATVLLIAGSLVLLAQHARASTFPKGFPSLARFILHQEPVRFFLPILLLFLCIALAPVALSLRSGGDWMPHYRFLYNTRIALVAGLGLFCGFLFGVPLHWIAERLDLSLPNFRQILTKLPSGLRPLPAAGFVVVGLLWLTALPVREAYGRWKQNNDAVSEWIEAVAQANPDVRILAATEVGGRIPYYAEDIPFIEYWGLTDKHIARNGRPAPPLGKIDPGYVASRDPDLLVFNNSNRATDFYRNWLHGGRAYHYVRFGESYSVLLKASLNQSTELALELAETVNGETREVVAGRYVGDAACEGTALPLAELAGRFPFNNDVLGMPWNGRVQAILNLDAGSQELQIRARGSQAQDEFAKLRITVQDRQQETTYLEEEIELNSESGIYVLDFFTPLTGLHSLSVEFFNDFGDETGDRNVSIFGICHRPLPED